MARSSHGLACPHVAGGARSFSRVHPFDPGQPDLLRICCKPRSVRTGAGPARTASWELPFGYALWRFLPVRGDVGFHRSFCVAISPADATGHHPGHPGILVLPGDRRLVTLTISASPTVGGWRRREAESWLLPGRLVWPLRNGALPVRTDTFPPGGGSDEVFCTGTSPHR